MNELYFVHALDDTTSFLNIFQEHFPENFMVIEPNSESIEKTIGCLYGLPKDSIIVFLGHGHSTGLYTPESEVFDKYIFINKDIGNELFMDKRVILLSCRSRDFIAKITSVKYIVGFGNILSSPEELRIEADLETGCYRNLSIDNINYFNSCYCNAIINALRKYQSGVCNFSQIPNLIEFYINQKINETLLNKEVHNRVEIARLLFEFRNEMRVISTNI